MTPVLEPDILPLIGESAWHSLIVDPRIPGESQRHYQEVMQVLEQYGKELRPELHILEVACYAHTTGYLLAENPGAQVTLFELSRHSLCLGRQSALPPGSPAAPNPRLVAGDFHHLPFADGSFNLVYICSALHHTWNYARVLREMIRVLAPGGLLFLENEPILRSLCFYQFRCNRPHEFSPFEEDLLQRGLLRTLAEPYLGSRPESLFGMVENQAMPLQSVLDIVQEKCEPLSVFLSTADCMGEWEAGLLRQRSRPAWDLASLIGRDLSRGFRAAEPLLTARERGLGFGIPAESQIQAMAQRIGQEICSLPCDENSGEFKLKLAHIFGAPLKLIARRSGNAGPTPAPGADQMRQQAGIFNQTHPCEAGVYNGFPPQVRPWLAQASRLPDVQTGGPEAVQEVFPPEHWRLETGHYPLIAMDGLTHHLKSLVNLGREADIRLPSSLPAGSALLVLRLFCNVQPDRFFRLELAAGERILCHYDAYQAENILFKIMLAPQLWTDGNRTLSLRLAPLDPAVQPPLPHLALSHAALYSLSGPE